MKYLGYVLKIILNEAAACVLLLYIVLSTSVSGYFYALDSDLLFPFFVGAIIVAGMAWRFISRVDLPDDFRARYWPALALLFFFLILAMYSLSRADASYDHDLLRIFVWETMTLAAFPAAFVFFSWNKELTSKKWLYHTCLVLCIALIVPFLQIKSLRAVYYTDMLPRDGYDGPTVAGDSAVIQTRDVSGDRYLLPELGFAPSLRLSENMPKIDGATAFFPIFFTLGREIYDTDSKTLSRYVSLSRTGDAYSRLIRGEADLIFVLQPSDEQSDAARQAGAEIRLIPIAREAFVFFVNENNPVSNLSLEQIQDIYLKKITDWKELGGDDETILPFQRPINSGSQTTMIKEVMKDRELPPPLHAEYVEMMGEIVRMVAEYRDYPGSLGYSFRYFAQNMVRYQDRNYRREPDRRELTAGRVKFLAVGGVAPTVENIRDKSYPFTVDIFIATAGTKNPHVQELTDWMLSPEGQKLVELAGYVGIGN